MKNVLLKEIKLFTTIDELEAFLLKHGESIVDLMGGEIDRIEMKIRVSENNASVSLFGGANNNTFRLFQKKFPEIRHCDLEIL